MNWINQCLNYIVTCVFLTLVNLIIFDFMGDYVEKKLITDAIVLDARFLDFIAQFIAMCLVMFFLAMNISAIASSLTGGNAVQTGIGAAIRTSSMVKSAFRSSGGKQNSATGG